MTFFCGLKNHATPKYRSVVSEDGHGKIAILKQKCIRLIFDLAHSISRFKKHNVSKQYTAKRGKKQLKPKGEPFFRKPVKPTVVDEVVKSSTFMCTERPFSDQKTVMNFLSQCKQNCDQTLCLGQKVLRSTKFKHRWARFLVLYCRRVTRPVGFNPFQPAPILKSQESLMMV